MINNRIIRVSILLIASSVLFQCRISHDVPAVRSALPVNYLPTQTDTMGLGDLDWKFFYSDTCLIRLIDTALIKNYDVNMAMKQVEIARANLSLSRGAQIPSLQIAGSTLNEKTWKGVGTGEELQTLFFSSSWEIDVWGKLKQLKMGDRSRLAASESSIQLARSLIIGEVAKAYYNLLAFDNELEIIERNVRLQNVALEIVRAQKQAGKATDLAVQQFEAQLWNTESHRKEIEQSIVEAENYINTLLNQFPRKVVRSSKFKELNTGITSAGIPAQMIERRADVRIAENNLKAADFDVSAARKAFYPALNLSPSIGFSAMPWSQFFTSQGAVWQLAGSLTAPLMQQNRLKSGLRIKKAEQEKALLTYSNTIILAFTEVQGLLKRIELLEQEIVNRKKECEVLRKAIDTANDLYAYGFATYLEVINAQKSAREAELLLTESQKKHANMLVDLYRSVGGGR